MQTTSRYPRLTPAGRRQLALMITLMLAMPLLAGCAEYLDRDDHISMQLGDAVAVNKATHTGNPWPSSSLRPELPHNAERILVGYDKYRSNAGAKEGEGGDPMSTQIAPAKPGGGSSGQ